MIPDVQHFGPPAIGGDLLAAKSCFSVALSKPPELSTGTPFPCATRSNCGTMPAASHMTTRRTGWPSERSSRKVAELPLYD